MENTLNQSKVNLSIRNVNFDILRFIGLLSIILAHTNPPEILYQLRNFDVPLMLIISGAVFGISSMKSKPSYKSYLKKRVLRLLLPTWLFLTLFFCLTYVLSVVSGYNYPFSKDVVLLSYALISGIGYVWIIRVFLLVACIAPLIFEIHSRTKSHLKYFVFILIIYIIYEIIYIKYTGINNKIDSFMENIVYYIVPYGCLFGIGIRLPTLNKKSIKSIIIINFIVFLVLMIINYYSSFPIQTQEYKYPPRIYYISYSIVVSLLLYVTLDKKILKVFDNKIVYFISRSSMSIYLWQILYIYLWNWSIYIRPRWTNSFIIMFSVVLFLSVTTTCVVTQLRELNKNIKFQTYFDITKRNTNK